MYLYAVYARQKKTHDVLILDTARVHTFPALFLHSCACIHTKDSERDRERTLRPSVICNRQRYAFYLSVRWERDYERVRAVVLWKKVYIVCMCVRERGERTSNFRESSSLPARDDHDYDERRRRLAAAQGSTRKLPLESLALGRVGERERPRETAPVCPCVYIGAQRAHRPPRMALFPWRHTDISCAPRSRCLSGSSFRGIFSAWWRHQARVLRLSFAACRRWLW